MYIHFQVLHVALMCSQVENQGSGGKDVADREASALGAGLPTNKCQIRW